MSPSADELTPAVFEQIGRLRHDVAGLMHKNYDTDWNLYRWLLGHHFNYEIVCDFFEFFFKF